MKKIADFCNKFSVILHFVLAFGMNFIIEAISRHSLANAWEYLMVSPSTFLFNTYMIFVTYFIVYIFKRRVFTRIIITVLWLVLGIVNGYMLSVRVTPFNAQDLLVVGDAITMIDQYLNGIQVILIGLAILVVIAWLVIMWKRGAIYEGKIYRIPAILLAAAAILSINPMTEAMIQNRIVSNYFGNIAFAYEDYGLPYCFAASLFNTGIDQPEVYGEAVINKVDEEGLLTEIRYDAEVKPNIILMQLESFFDTNEVEFFTTSEDPIPTFRYLMENYTSGYCKVPSVGAGTANTEFEVLTGMNLRYFGPGEYPYKTLLKYQETESVAS
ncbi:MAG: LTA synthase family protein, partial [Lachnospiraceae bacterium]|nr:LTA synthase family protein [Lachnospiraceae bacterium]